MIRESTVQESDATKVEQRYKSWEHKKPAAIATGINLFSGKKIS